jgi:hypothetical protein
VKDTAKGDAANDVRVALSTRHRVRGAEQGR